MGGARICGGGPARPGPANLQLCALPRQGAAGGTGSGASPGKRFPYRKTQLALPRPGLLSARPAPPLNRRRRASRTGLQRKPKSAPSQLRCSGSWSPLTRARCSRARRSPSRSPGYLRHKDDRKAPASSPEPSPFSGDGRLNGLHGHEDRAGGSFIPAPAESSMREADAPLRASQGQGRQDRGGADPSARRSPADASGRGRSRVPD